MPGNDLARQIKEHLTARQVGSCMAFIRIAAVISSVLFMPETITAV